MASYDEHRRRPQARLNKSGWRLVTVGSILLSFGLIAALVAQTSFPGSDRGSSDGLTTLALALAVTAFLVQIAVFMYQSVENAQTVSRAEDLHVRTQTALESIKTQSDATQQVLTSQFSRVLEHALGGRPPRGVTDSDDGADGAAGNEAKSGGTSSGSWERFADLTMFAETRRSAEDQAIRQRMERWPKRDVAESAVDQLASLSPLALSLLVRAANLEYRQRGSGQLVGMRCGDHISPWTAQLMDAGLLALRDDRLKLTETALGAVGVLPFGRLPSDKRPDWIDEVLKPLWTVRG